MILQSLTQYYQRLLEHGGDIAPYGFSPEKISYVVVLSENGEVVSVRDFRVKSGKKDVPQTQIVPQPAKRTVGIKPNFLWDKTSYIFGVSTVSKRADQEHAAFREFHLNALADTEDIGLCALKRFLENWTPEQFDTSEYFSEDMKDANMTFALDGERLFLHERSVACELWAKLFEGAESSKQGMCLVNGEITSLARLHPAIKGVDGAQSSGASIVSFNLDAFKSYGKDQGENAPVSEQATFAYTTALNYLLRRGEDNRQRIQIGDATVVFWAEAENNEQAQVAESVFMQMLDQKSDDPQETEKIRQVLEGVSKGRPLRNIDPELDEGTCMFILGLAPNASRLSIRFWETGTFGELAKRIANHEQDMHLEPLPWKTPPSVRRLALATAPSRNKPAEAKDIPAQLAGELMRAILSGRRYPQSLLTNLIMRMRADGDISGVRVALCKAVLTRNQRLKTSTLLEEENLVSLDKQSTNPAYQLGRLFAVLENVQRNALGENVNATIRDRYYGAASATPASIFPVLLRNTQNHLSKLHKEKKGLAVILEKQIGEIIDGLDENLPRSLPIEEQGRFAIGYYHQSRAHFTKGREKNDEETETTEEGVTE
jgi:CRISPR-associated protein Cas8c/Csd1, subtype I-C/DVULG